MPYFTKVSYRVVLKYGERIAMRRIACIVGGFHRGRVAFDLRPQR